MYNSETTVTGVSTPLPVMQADVTLTFGQGDDESMSWDAYIALVCAGAKALFFHERPIMKLDLEAVVF